jgi:hypothetical protein
LKRLVLLLPLVLAQPAQAAHCPHGQIWRVHARVCLDKLTRREAAPPKLANIREFRQSRHQPLTYVQVIEPEIDIPYELPPSRWNHLAVARFDALPQPARSTYDRH